MWEREEEFRSLLRRAATKATKDMLDTIADIAIRDDKVVGCQRCAGLLGLCRRCCGCCSAGGSSVAVLQLEAAQPAAC